MFITRYDMNSYSADTTPMYISILAELSKDEDSALSGAHYRELKPHNILYIEFNFIEASYKEAEKKAISEIKEALPEAVLMDIVSPIDFRPPKSNWPFFPFILINER